MKNMDRWLGNGGMPIIETIGGRFDKYGLGQDDLAFCEGIWIPTQMACNPHGTAQAGVQSVILDAAMNFAINSGLEGKDRTKATIEMKTNLIRAAFLDTQYVFVGRVIRITKQVGFGFAEILNADNEVISNATGSFLLHRDIAEL